jgi:hypothetical protein
MKTKLEIAIEGVSEPLKELIEPYIKDEYQHFTIEVDARKNGDVMLMEEMSIRVTPLTVPNNTFREEIDREFDEEFVCDGEPQAYPTIPKGDWLHTASPATVKSFLHDSQRRLVEKLVGDLTTKYGDGTKEALVLIEPTESGVSQRPALEEVIGLINQTLK